MSNNDLPQISREVARLLQRNEEQEKRITKLEDEIADLKSTLKSLLDDLDVTWEGNIDD